MVTLKDEESLRDLALIVLNGTYQGAATGETFVKEGKTDILVRIEDRHVFVGECKWWDGPKACGDAVDQLLRYLPWRDEKGALIVFINRKDATEAPQARAWLALNQAHRSPNGIASVTSVDPVGALGRAKTSFMIKIVPDSLLALAKSEKAIHRLMSRLNNGAVPRQPLLDLSIAGLRPFVAKQPFPKRLTDQELRGITMPTLLLLCERSPVNDAQRAEQRARLRIADVEVDVVADSGHMLPAEHPELFTQRVLSFVDGVDMGPTAPRPRPWPPAHNRRSERPQRADPARVGGRWRGLARRRRERGHSNCDQGFPCGA